MVITRQHQLIVAVGSLLVFILYWYSGYILWYTQRNGSGNDSKVPFDEENPYVFQSRKIAKEKLQNIPSEWIDAKKCPACYGMSLCDEISRENIKIDIPSKHTNLSQRGIYFGMWTDFPVVIKRLVKNETEFNMFDKFICTSAKLDLRCDVSKAILHTPMVKEKKISSSFAKEAFVAIHTDHQRIFRPSLCMTDKLVAEFKEAFFSKVPFHMTEDEPILSMMYTNLVLNPEGLMLSFLTNDNSFHDMVFPKLLGACGRVVVVEDAGLPLETCLTEPFYKRASVALELISLVEHFTTSDVNWFIFYSDFKHSDFALSNLGSVRLVDAEDVMIIDKEESKKVAFPESKEVCNTECFRKIFENIHKPASATQNYKSCATIAEHDDVMMALLCNNVLSDAEDHKKSVFGKPHNGPRPDGLLHSAPDVIRERLNNLLRQCVHENLPGGRRKAWEELKSLLSDEEKKI